MTAPRRIARFLATGVLNTAVGYGLYVLFVALGMAYLPALALATVLGVIFNFFSFGKLAFRAALGGATFVRFVAGYGASLALNAGLLWLAHEKLGLDPYTAQLACLPPTVLATWLVLDHWVYAPARPHGT